METKKLIQMGFIHFVIMFVLMYSMVYAFDHLYFNLNKVYMAAIMTAPMLILEIIMMGQMHKNKKGLAIIAGLSIIALLMFFIFIRQQTFIYDKEFLRSMIPHHSSAILMCNEGKINDQEIKKLCEEIVKTQKEEINQMKNILSRLD